MRYWLGIVLSVFVHSHLALAQDYSYLFNTSGNEYIGGIIPLKDSTLLIARNSKNFEFTNIERYADDGRLIGSIKLQDSSLTNIEPLQFERIGAYLILNYQGRKKVSNLSVAGFVVFDSCLAKLKVFEFVNPNGFMRIGDFITIDGINIFFTLHGVDKDYSELFKLNLNSNAIMRSYKYGKIIESNLASDGSHIYFSGHHYFNSNSVYYLKLGMLKFDRDLNLMWYRVHDESSTGAGMQGTNLQYTGSAISVSGAYRAPERISSIEYILDSSGRFVDSVLVEAESEYSLLDGYFSNGNGQGLYALLNYPDKQLNRFYPEIILVGNQRNEEKNRLSLYEPLNSSDKVKSRILDVQWLNTSSFLVYGISNAQDLLNFNAFVAKYDTGLSLLKFSAFHEVDQTCMMQDTGMIYFKPDTSYLVDSSGSSEVNHPIDFLLNNQNWNNSSLPNPLIYPNPSADNLYVDRLEGFGISNVTLYNHLGQVVITQSFRGFELNQIKLDVSSLENGVYFIELVSDSVVVRRKVEIVR